MKRAKDQPRFRDLTRAKAVAICLLVIVLGVPILSAVGGKLHFVDPASASGYPGDPFRVPRLLEEEVEEEEREPDEEPRIIRRYSTRHVPARVIRDVAGTLGIDVQTVIFPTNAYAMWVRGTAEAHAQLRDFIGGADVPANEMSLNYEMLTLEYIPPARAVDLLSEIGVELDRYFYFGSTLVVFDAEVLRRWDEVGDLIQMFDAPPSQEEVVFTYSLEHLSAQDAGGILDTMQFEGVSTRSYDYPDADIARELVVVCPPQMEERVRSVLADIDSRRSSIRMPIDSERGEGAREELMARRRLLAQLSGVSERAMRISDNLTHDEENPWYVLWVEETPTNIQLLQKLLGEIN